MVVLTSHLKKVRGFFILFNMAKEKKRELIACLGILFVTAIWGFAFVVVKNTFDFVSTGYMLAIRFSIAAIVMSIVFIKRIVREIKKNVGIIKHGIVMGILLFLAYLSQTYGCMYTTAGKNAFLTTIYVVLVPFVTFLLFGKKIKFKVIIATFLSLIGVGLISLGTDLTIHLGDALTIVCGVLFAIHISYIDNCVQDDDSFVVTSIQFVTAAVLSFIYAPIVEGDLPVGAFSYDGLTGLLYLGLGSTLICFLLQTICQKYLPGEVCAIAMSFEAVFGAVFSAIFLSEMFTSRMILGCVLMFVAVIIVEVSVLPIFYPDERMDSAYEIDYERLYEEGVRGLIFDIDNTLVCHNAPANDASKSLFERLNNIGFKVLLLSNNKEGRVKGFKDDACPEGFYIYKAGKPSRKGYIKAMEIMGTDISSTVFIGDQLFTDVWGAKRSGIRNILTKPINPKEEIQIVLKRILERIVLCAYEREGK